MFLHAAVLEVERYDHKPIEGGHARIHQEDFCQALAVMPERKYTDAILRRFQARLGD